MKLVNALLIIGSSFSLAACNQATMPDMTSTGSVFASTKAPAYQHTLAERRPVQEAFVTLPAAAGQVVEVVEFRYGNGVEQQIVLGGDFDTRGENVARVRLVVNNVWPKPVTGQLKATAPTRLALAREMRKSLSGVTMRTSNELHNNAYGPFGYALGQAGGGVQCIYGWQHLRGNGRKTSDWTIFRSESKKPELSLRLRVCRQGASSQEMVDLMRHIRIDADPARALKPGKVAWNSAPQGDLLLAVPGYQPSGYTSQPVAEPTVDLDEAEPVIRKPMRKKARKPRPNIAKISVREVAPKRQYAAVPIPGTMSSEPKPVLKPVKTVYKNPIVLRDKPTSGDTYAAVPLPE